jgi:hypothetical protein
MKMPTFGLVFFLSVALSNKCATDRMISMTTVSKKEKLLSLHRYYIWANKMRDHFDSTLMTSVTKDGSNGMDAFMYMGYWYGTIYAVAEGWIELGLKDDAINTLLKSDNLGLLKRYRNGVFHYQKEYNDARFTDLYLKGREVVDWVRQLNQELGKYFLDEMNIHQ